MQLIVHQNIDAIRACCEARGVSKLVIFGSATKDRGFDQRSDIDCVVEFKHDDPLTYGRAFFALLDDLQQILGRKIDLITDRSIRNPAFRAEIRETGETLYAA